MDRIAPTSYLSRMFSIVHHGRLRFLILDCPSESTLPSVLRILVKESVVAVVRVCEPTYDAATLNAVGIAVHDMSFKDGGTPPAHVLARFMSLVDSTFYGPSTASASASASAVATQGGGGSSSPTHGPTLATTDSGLALAPPASSSSTSRPSSTASASSLGATTPAADGGTATVAAAAPPITIAVHCVAGLGRAPVLIACALIEAGMSPLDAIDYVRARRRGAFNTQQVKYLDSYKPQHRLGHAAEKRAGSGRGSPRGLFGLGGGGNGMSLRRAATESSSEPVGLADAEVAMAAGHGRSTPSPAPSSSGSIGGWSDSVRAKLGKLVGLRKRSSSAKMMAVVPPTSSSSSSPSPTV
ncbi:protein-tyrosine phosphatase-like protein [Blastocladiella britannica]|nr:protein-tyrosine phosphatase-like protein [Blastocladiella britannica]